MGRASRAKFLLSNFLNSFSHGYNILSRLTTVLSLFDRQ